MSKIKKLSSCVLALLLVVCVGYFSVMSQTSAWFYDKGVVDSGDSFTFGNLSVNNKFVVKKNAEFDGATKFADKNEKGFDDVINIVDVVVTNAGTIPARVYSNVVNNGNSKGLRWFFYEDSMLVDNSVKATIEKILSQLDDESLQKYNTEKYILLQPGEETTVKIALWVEYDDVEEELKAGKVLDGYNTEISIIASQDVDGAVK